MADIRTEIFGIKFRNPVFTAAGPTSANYSILKKAFDGGAGGIVTKTISVKPARVPIPNISSYAPGNLLNAELWSETVYKKFIDEELTAIRKIGLPVIASLGYSPEDLALLGKELNGSGLVDAVEFSIHYVEKNADNLKRTAAALKNNIDVPVIAKLSPALSDLEFIVKTLDPIVDGYAAINSIGPALDFDIETLRPYLGSADGRGWLSGHAILPVGLHFVSAISSLSSKPVIGVGGIRKAEDAIKYFLAGASAVQVCTLSILKGQSVYGKLAGEINKWLDAHEYPDLNSIIGLFGRQESRKEYFLYEGAQLFPRIDYDICNNCGTCVTMCVHEALDIKNDRLELDKDLCVRCGLCVTICPKGALEMKEAGI